MRLVAAPRANRREFVPWLGLVVLAAVVAAAVAVAVLAIGPLRRLPAGPRPSWPRSQWRSPWSCALAGPAAYAADTMATAHAGGDPSAGPAVATSVGPDGGAGASGNGRGGAPPGRRPIDGGAGGPGRRPDRRPAAGGPDGAATADADLIDYLVANRGDATWLVAVSGVERGRLIQLATGVPVMAMGGFMGSDPAPTLEELKAAIASGELRFVIVDGGLRGRRLRRGRRRLRAATGPLGTETCTAVDVGGSTVYDCAGAT